MAGLTDTQSRLIDEASAASAGQHGPVTMGYYTRADLPFCYALADAFTVCDAYFSSVLGPTDSNRLTSPKRPPVP